MEEYSPMHLENALMVDEGKEPNSNILLIVLLNIQSFSKHVLDLKCDQKSDVLLSYRNMGLTTSTSVSELPEFNISHNSRYDDFKVLQHA